MAINPNQQPEHKKQPQLIAPAKKLAESDSPSHNGHNSEVLVEFEEQTVVTTEVHEVETTIAEIVPEKASIFHNRQFMSLWIAQALSQTAQNTLNLSLVAYVGTLTDYSPTQTSLETVAFVLPGVLFSALAGVFVDRLNKRTMLIVTNVVRALLVPWLIFMNGSLPFAVPLIFLVTLLFSTVSQFFAPAESAMIPLLVSPSQLTKANSLFQLTYFGATFVGFSILAPILPTVIGPTNLFLALSVLYLICTVLVWLLPKNLEKIEEPLKNNAQHLLQSVWHELKQGMTFIWHEKTVRLAIVYLTTVQAMLFVLASVGINYVQKDLLLPQSAIIFVLAPLSIGLGTGVVLINKFVNVRNRNRILVFAAIALGLNLAAIGLIKIVAEVWVGIFTPGLSIGGPGLIMLIIVFSVTFGFELALLQIPSLTILQERSPKDIIGRVYAAYFTFSNLATIAPVLFAGALGDLIGLVPVFFIVGAAVVLVGYYGHRQQPKLY